MMRMRALSFIGGTAVIAACGAFGMLAQAQSVRPVQTFETSAGPVKITPIYHASLMIEAGGKTIYLDPAKPANFDGLPHADLILITDIHGDHMDPNSIAAVSKSGTEIFAPPAVVATVTTASPISNGESKSWNGWTIEAIPMYNVKNGGGRGERVPSENRDPVSLPRLGHQRVQEGPGRHGHRSAAA
ncbi:MAG: MBL fold metallo-hydrolase [Candidatus Acidiferrales bacterium]